MCSHSDANAAKSEHMAHLCPCSHHLRPCFCPPARLRLANSHNMLAGIGSMVDSARVLPLLACQCSIMNAPMFNNERTCVHLWTLSAELPSKSEHPRLCHTQPAQRLDYVYGVAAISGSRKVGVSSTDRPCGLSGRRASVAPQSRPSARCFSTAPAAIRKSHERPRHAVCTVSTTLAGH